MGTGVVKSKADTRSNRLEAMVVAAMAGGQHLSLSHGGLRPSDRDIFEVVSNFQNWPINCRLQDGCRVALRRRMS